MNQLFLLCSFAVMASTYELHLHPLTPQILSFFPSVMTIVLSLEYLMDTIVKKLKPIDWEVFYKKQQDQSQVLKVVASGLLSRKAVVMSAEKKNFQTLDQLTECMKASMLLPGVTGEVVRLKGSQAEGDNIEKTWWREWVRYDKIT